MTGPRLRVAVAGSADGLAEVEFVREAERLGADSAWVPELWGYDALTQLGYLAARTSRIALGTSIVQLGARSPALLATSALSLQQLSGGRFRLGLGVSGPQVMEGWHGVPFRRPVQLTRETIEIIRMVSRGDRLDYQGQLYQLPLPGGQGRALRPATPPGAGAHLPSTTRPSPGRGSVTRCAWSPNCGRPAGETRPPRPCRGLWGPGPTCWGPRT